MKSFKILNLVTTILFSSEKTSKLMNGGVLIRAGGSEIFSKKISGRLRFFWDIIYFKVFEKFIQKCQKSSLFGHYLMMMMMMMMMMMNCFCDMVDQRKMICLFSSRDHCQRFWPSRIFDTPQTGFEPVQNLRSGLVEWSCAVAITTTPRHH